MITILTQNKVGIHDCEKLQIGHNGDGYAIAVGYPDEPYVLLGTYATEKRAEEVLMEIWKVISMGDFEIYGKFYEMPEV